MSQIPFYLVTGFLGSGKTTFLKHMLATHASKKRIAIIQNEFAPANIDGEELRNEGKKFEILEINNGSVFCVCLLNNFISSLSEFIEEHRPEAVFLEASGLSDPIAIAQLLDFKDLQKHLYLARVWTIIDSANFLRQHMLVTRLQHQIRVADVVICNKTDLVSSDVLQEIEKIVTSLNPFARIMRSTYCKLNDAELVIDQLPESVALKTKDENTQFESCGRPEVGIGVLRSSRSISKENLTYLIDIYSKKTIRIKGFAKLEGGEGMAVQTSYEIKAFKEVSNYHGSTELIAMGEGFNLSEFSRNYRELAS